MNVKKAIELLGLEAEDKVTGLKGILTGVSFDLYGCVQYVLQPPKKDNKVPDSHWMDSNRLIVSDERKMKSPDYGRITDVLKYDKGPADKPASSRF